MDNLVVGAILAGGKGERIGGRKALVDLCGAPLILHVARALRFGAGAIAVVGDEEAAQIADATRLDDPPGVSRGPLAGVCAALEWAKGKASWLALAPCDTPFLPNDFVQRFLEAQRNTNAPVLCARAGDGVHPLISLWRVDLASDVRATLRDGAHPSMHGFIAACGAAYVDFPASELANVNTPGDLAQARARLGI